MGAGARKEFERQKPFEQGVIADERVASRLADMAHVEPYEPRPGPGPNELRVLYREESQAKRRREARPGLWMAVAIYVLFSATDLLL
ncbi:MAG: GGDEF-domain containing protein, partial [Mesorhizobium sp.]